MITIFKTNNEHELKNKIQNTKYKFCRIYTTKTIKVEHLNVFVINLKPLDYDYVCEFWNLKDTCLHEYSYDSENLQKMYSLKNILRTYFYHNNICSNYYDYMLLRKRCNSPLYVSTAVGLKDKIENKALCLVTENVLSRKQLKSNYMNEATDYGALFLRGEEIKTKNNTLTLISGTASISSSGDILYLNNIEKQFRKIKHNISSLYVYNFYEYDFYIIYVKDFNLLTTYLKNTFRELNCVVLEADVCRSGWLIEVETLKIM